MEDGEVAVVDLDSLTLGVRSEDRSSKCEIIEFPGRCPLDDHLLRGRFIYPCLTLFSLSQRLQEVGIELHVEDKLRSRTIDGHGEHLVTGVRVRSPVLYDSVHHEFLVAGERAGRTGIGIVQFVDISGCGFISGCGIFDPVYIAILYHSDSFVDLIVGQSLQGRYTGHVSLGLGVVGRDIDVVILSNH